MRKGESGAWVCEYSAGRGAEQSGEDSEGEGGGVVVQCGEDGVFRGEDSDAGGISRELAAWRVEHVLDSAGEGQEAGVEEEEEWLLEGLFVKSINESINESINDLINESINDLINESINESMNRSTNESLNSQ